jgi:hypothetical protein
MRLPLATEQRSKRESYRLARLEPMRDSSARLRSSPDHAADLGWWRPESGVKKGRARFRFMVMLCGSGDILGAVVVPGPDLCPAG